MNKLFETNFKDEIIEGLSLIKKSKEDMINAEIVKIKEDRKKIGKEMGLKELYSNLVEMQGLSEYKDYEKDASKNYKKSSEEFLKKEGKRKLNLAILTKEINEIDKIIKKYETE